MFRFIENSGVACPVMPATPPAHHHAAFQAAQHSAPDNCRPGMDGVVDLDGFRGGHGEGVGRPVTGTGDPAVEVVVLGRTLRVSGVPSMAGEARC